MAYLKQNTVIIPDDTAKAWMNFNGTGTVAIRDSYNCTSLTDNGTGDYIIDTKLIATDHALLATCNTSVNYLNAASAWISGTNQVRVLCSNYTTTNINSTKYDTEYVHMALF